MHELQVSTHCDSLQVFTDWSKKVNEQNAIYVTTA